MTTRRRGIAIAVAVFAVAVLAVTAAATIAAEGSTESPASPPADPVTGRPAPAPSGGSDVGVNARGRVTSVTTGSPGGDVLGSFLVEGPRDPSLICDKASLTVTTDTRFYLRTPDGDVPLDDASMALLEPGIRVEVTITGPVAESYPVQATAAIVTIVE